MLRWLATFALLALLALDLLIPGTPLGRRGSEAATRDEVVAAVGELGAPLPDFELQNLDGGLFRLADFRGQRVLLTFERSLDW